MGRASRWADPFTAGMAPTLILQFPLLQLRLNLVQHHSQLPEDLLQVAHVIVLQDLGLRAGQAGEVLQRELVS